MLNGLLDGPAVGHLSKILLIGASIGRLERDLASQHVRVQVIYTQATLLP